MKKKILSILGCILISFSIMIVLMSLFDKRYYAFDGAEGYGAYADGGRHGKAYHVTTLEDNNNEGSLRYAIEQDGSRTIVFDISGIINLKSPLIINHGGLTIAGQTAPGDGICLKGNSLVINANNVIIRYLRIRPGITPNNISALIINNAKNIIIDHCSVSWAKGGNVILNRVENITIQWSFITETLGNFAIDFIGRNKNISIHHNFFCNNHNSNIHFNEGYINKNVDIRNNVFYNWDKNSILNPGMGEFNIVNNYYKSGPNTDKNNKNQLVSTIHSPKNIKMLYVNGNEVYINPILSKNNTGGIYPNIEFLQTAKNSYMTLKEYYHAPVSTHSGEKTKQRVLDFAGTSIMRDYPDLKVIKDFEISSFNNMNLYTNFGVYPSYKSKSIFIDLDNDGVRDDWEVKNNMNPFNPLDVYDQNKKKRGYTNRDVYFDSFVEDITKKQQESTLFNIDNIKIKLFKFVSNIK